MEGLFYVDGWVYMEGWPSMSGKDGHVCTCVRVDIDPQMGFLRPLALLPFSSTYSHPKTLLIGLRVPI